MENPDFKKESEGEGAEEVYSKAVRAGRRTYFFDVKATRNDDYYITVTESRKKTGKDGGFTFEKQARVFQSRRHGYRPRSEHGRTVRQTVTVSERWPLRGLPFSFGMHATETELDSLSGPKRRPAQYRSRQGSAGNQDKGPPYFPCGHTQSGNDKRLSRFPDSAAGFLNASTNEHMKRKRENNSRYKKAANYYSSMNRT